MTSLCVWKHPAVSIIDICELRHKLSLFVDLCDQAHFIVICPAKAGIILPISAIWLGYPLNAGSSVAIKG